MNEKPVLINGWVNFGEEKKDQSNPIACVICNGKTKFESNDKLSLICGKHLVLLTEAKAELDQVKEFMKNNNTELTKNGKVLFTLPKNVDGEN